MKYLALLIACALPLAACETVGTTPITNPSAVANQTALDEKAALGAEQTYKLWRQLVEIGVNAGQIKGERAARVRQLDTQIYAGLVAVEKAYAAGNSVTLGAAIANFYDAVASGRAAVGGQ